MLLKHPARAKWQEFLPLIGLAATLISLALALAWYWTLPAAYGGVLAVSATVHCLRQRELSGLFGVPLCLFMLHVSFTLGLVDGLLRKGKPSSDRA